MEMRESSWLQNWNQNRGIKKDRDHRAIIFRKRASVPLRHDCLNPDSAEVTYVTINLVRISSVVDFEVFNEKSNLILCRSLDMIEAGWSNESIVGLDRDTGWSVDCYVVSSIAVSGFVQPKMGITNPSIEVYLVGFTDNATLILMQTVSMSPRRTVARPGELDVIPEDWEGNAGKGGSATRRLGGKHGERRNG